MDRLWISYVFLQKETEVIVVDRETSFDEASAERNALKLIDLYKNSFDEELYPAILWQQVEFEGAAIKCLGSPVLYVNKLVELSISAKSISAEAVCKVIEISDFKKRKMQDFKQIL